MASLLGPVLSEVAALLGGSGIGSTVARGAVAGVGAVAASQLLKAIEADLAPGSAPTAKATARHVPQYAIVDLHNNKVVRFLSTRHVYSIITHPRRKTYRKTIKVISAGTGQELVTVR